MNFLEKFPDPCKKDDSGNADEFIKFAAFLLKLSDMGPTSLKTGTRAVIDQAGLMSDAFGYAQEHQELASKLDKDAVMTFANGQPESDACKEVRCFHSHTEGMDAIMEAPVGVYQGLPDPSKAILKEWAARMKSASQALFQKCLDIVLENESAAPKIQPEGGWAAAAMNEEEMKATLASLEGAIQMMMAFQYEGAPPCARLVEAQAWATELGKLLDVGLTDEQRIYKSEISELVQALQETFPSFSLEQVKNMSCDQITQEIVPRKKIGEAAGKLFAKVGDGKGLAGLGEDFQTSVQKVMDYSRVALAIQSAMAVLKTKDPEKAAAFEEKKLKPRHLSINDVPSSISTALAHCAATAKQWDRVQSSNRSPCLSWGWVGDMCNMGPVFPCSGGVLYSSHALQTDAWTFKLNYYFCY